MTEDQVREMVRRAAEPFKGKRKGSSGMAAWCREKGVNRHHANEFLNAKRGPTSDLLSALGLEYQIAPARSRAEELIERLRGPVQWGYMCLADGGFIRDDTPFEAATHIERLTAPAVSLRNVLTRLVARTLEYVGEEPFADGLECDAEMRALAFEARALLDRDSDGPRMAETAEQARGEAGPARASEGGIAQIPEDSAP